MRTQIKILLQLITIGILINSTSCINKEIDDKEFEKKQKTKKSTIYKSDDFYYYSSANNQKYNHQIKGVDENGKNVNGVINLEDEIGIGVLKGNDNKEIEIISEHINSNGIIATDINGTQYKLKVD